MEVWGLGFQEMLKQPILGLGYGKDTFKPLMNDWQGISRPMHLHSTFLMVGVSSGWPALIFLLWVFVGAARSLQSQLSKVSDMLPYGMIVGTGIMILGFVVRNLFDSMFEGSLAYLFWILLAAGLVYCMKDPETAK